MERTLCSFPTVRKATLFEGLPEGKVRCSLCERRCTLQKGELGHCRTRKNIEGHLYTLVYGDISAIESRPIEVKPLFHYWPGSTALTLSTWSCNFDCPWCQNFHLSKLEPDPENANFYPVEKVTDLTLRRGDEGMCISFQEPTLLFDWAFSLFTEGCQKGLYACIVSNGYMTDETLRLLKQAGMDGLNVDIKGDTEVYQKYCNNVDLNLVWRNIRETKKLGLHIEVVNLLVTGVSDSDACVDEVIERHLKEAGEDTPLHFTRYYPAYKFDLPPTRLETLETAYQRAKKAGVLYPYIGNVLGHKFENTYCPECDEVLIKRLSYSVKKYNITKDKRCPKCGNSILIRGEYVHKDRAYFVA